MNALLLACYLGAWGLLTLSRRVPTSGHIALGALLAAVLWQPLPGPVASASSAPDPAPPTLAESPPAAPQVEPQAVTAPHVPSAAPVAVPASLARWSDVVNQAAGECGIDPAILWAVMDIESDGRPELVSDAGAVGLMQVMPREAGPLFVNRPARAELLDPLANVRWSACHLKGLIDSYGPYDAFRRYYGLGGSKTEWYAATATDLARKYASNPAPDPAPQASPAQAPPPFASTPLLPMPGIFKAFGAKVDYQAGGAHTGIDVANPREGGLEPPIYAVHAGTVAHVGPLYCDRANACRGSSAIVLDHGSNLYTIYSHNSAASVAPGQLVTAGQEIGRQGNEGYSFGSHLHFEVHTGAPWSGDWRAPFNGGQFEDPQKWLP